MEKIINYWLEKIYEKIIDLASTTNPKMLNVPQAARYMSIEKSTVHKMTSERRIRHYKPEKKLIYFSREDLDAYLLRNPVDTLEDIERAMIERNSKRK